jgi:hypothetical protein
MNMLDDKPVLFVYDETKMTDKECKRSRND